MESPIPFEYLTESLERPGDEFVFMFHVIRGPTLEKLAKNKIHPDNSGVKHRKTSISLNLICYWYCFSLIKE